VTLCVLPPEGHIAAAQQLEPLTDRRVTVRRGHNAEEKEGTRKLSTSGGRVPIDFSSTDT
jgi:hypothetical protein